MCKNDLMNNGKVHKWKLCCWVIAAYSQGYVQDRLLLIKQRRTFTQEDFKVLESNVNIVLTLLKQIYFKNN